MMKRLILAAVFAAGVCGAFGAPIVKDGDTVAFLGDSITQYGQRNPVGYVNLVIDALATEGVKIKAVRAGVSGHKSNDMLARLERDVLSKKPQWMTLSCGVNDVWHGFYNPPRGVALPDYKKNITAILDKCEAAGVKVIVLTATMVSEDPADKKNAALAPYNEWLRETAKARGLPLADLNARMQEDLAAMPPAKGNRLTKDGVHMILTGDKMMAKGVLAAMGVEKARESAIEANWRKIPGGGSYEISLTLDERARIEAEAKADGKTLDAYMRGKLGL